jgi:DNA modification methylase
MLASSLIGARQPPTPPSATALPREAEAQSPSEQHLTVLPVSVIDIEAQGKRKNESHSNTSSRANYSPFPEEIASLCCEFFLRDATHIFDPFAGWGERGMYAERHGKRYTGYDTSPEAIAKARAEYAVENTLADSRTAAVPSFDGLLTCPPYWNLEKYAAEEGIDRIRSWSDFLAEYALIFGRAYSAAAPGATFCVMVGDWRKNHVYYDLDFETCRIFREFGATVVDKLVVSRKKISKIKIMLPQAKRLGYSVRVHETLLVFRKPSTLQPSVESTTL